ncbi:MAG: MFS transporter [Pseudomonadota bacterium]|uniref:MFS transporter n=1 Tax=unclassified Phenylobacterium TaxID=2640670 RepID=UPI0006F26031|nr:MULTISPECIES: MFS transporter [unclassified Phenylobacterium]KRB41263.1 Fosmidomycin resistance protein [Phenylobacterium sp. Root700]MBT9472078.1 MFS transporter [Phenylobacterium sp.]
MSEQIISVKPATQPVAGTAFGVILAISFCHLLNDMMQSLLPAIYPNLKVEFGLTFGQIGVVTLAYQLTASILQPMIGLYADKRPTPMALPAGTLFSLAGLAVLSVAHSYPMLLAGACLLGMGSSVFHPESSRVARMAAGGRFGLAQSLFQVGGNAGSALGPLAAAVVVVRWGQSSLAFFALLALLSGGILWNVANWYRTHGLTRLQAAAKHAAAAAPPTRQAVIGIGILLALIFSKYVYLASLTNYLTFYMIDRFGASVQAAQFHLFAFLGAVAVGTVAGGPLGDRFGRKYVIWFSILGVLPFSLLLPFANEFWTLPLTVVIGLILASAFPAIVVYAQELAPGRVGMISGLFFGFSFGMGGIGAAVLGLLADATSIETVYRVCAFLPAIGLLAGFLPKVEQHRQPPPTPGLEPETVP